MANNILLSNQHYNWETPKELFDELNNEFYFTLDPCCTKENAKCSIYYTIEDNGLNMNWGKHRVFMNPPYGRQISKWVEKAYSESLNGTLVVCLLPSRTDTKWWWDYCMKGEIRFIKGRLKFKGMNTQGEIVKNSSTFPSAIVIFNGVV